MIEWSLEKKNRKSYFLIYTEHQGHRVSPLVVSFPSSPIGLKSSVTCSDHSERSCVVLTLFCCSWHRLYVFPRLTRVARFSTLSTGHTFSRGWHRLHVFPLLRRVTRFPSLAGTGYVFPRLARETCFPALGKGYTFSRTWHRLHVFPLLTRLTRFLMLESCNFDLWFWLVPHMNWLAFTFCGSQNRINLKVNHTKSKRLLKSSNLFLNVVSQFITRASSSSRLSGSWLCLTWRALCLSTVVKKKVIALLG